MATTRRSKSFLSIPIFPVARLQYVSIDVVERCERVLRNCRLLRDEATAVIADNATIANDNRRIRRGLVKEQRTRARAEASGTVGSV